MSSEEAYQKLSDFLSDLERRGDALWTREQTITKELLAQESEYGEAAIRGDHQAVEQKIAALKTELAAVQKERFFVTNPPKTGVLLELAEAAWQETVNEITITYRERWNAELIQLERAKAMFLAAVAELGQIKAEADYVTSRSTEAMIRCGYKKAVPSLSTSIFIRPDYKRGPIFLDDGVVEKTYTGRK
jgi:hypothetical protein